MPPEDLQVISAILRRNRNRNLLFSATGLALGLGLFWFDWTQSPIWEWTCNIIGLGIAAACIVILDSVVKKWNIAHGEISRLLREKPETVSWVYAMILESVPFGIKTLDATTIYLHLIDGSRTDLPLRRREVENVMNLLRSLLPTATFGHSLEKEQLYRADPRMLKREPPDA